MNRNALEIIKKYNAGRRPDTLGIKYKIMASNPFSFFRGTCHLFYQDLVQSRKKFSDPTKVWLCGDLHLENFGVYKGENQLIYFDINDFDESTLAPCTHDLARFITSLYLSSEVLGLKTKDLDRLANYFLSEFSRDLSLGKAKVMEEPCAKGIILHYFKQIQDRTKKTLVKSWMEEKGGKWQFTKNSDHLIPLEESQKNALLTQVIQFLEEYYPEKKNILEESKMEENTKKTAEGRKNPLVKRIKPLDAAFRIAGTGSLGLSRFIAAIEMDERIKFIDVKEAQYPSINLFEKGPKWSTDSTRICSIQSMMQGTPPSMLSALVFEQKNYVVRALQPEIDKLNLEEIKSNKTKIKEIIGDMARITASAYLRSSGWKKSSTLDSLIAFGSRTDWQKSVLAYGKAYVSQVKADYSAFKKDYNSQSYSSLVPVKEKAGKSSPNEKPLKEKANKSTFNSKPIIVKESRSTSDSKSSKEKSSKMNETRPKKARTKTKEPSLDTKKKVISNQNGIRDNLKNKPKLHDKPKILKKKAKPIA